MVERFDIKRESFKIENLSVNIYIYIIDLKIAIISYVMFYIYLIKLLSITYE